MKKSLPNPVILTIVIAIINLILFSYIKSETALRDKRRAEKFENFIRDCEFSLEVRGRDKAQCRNQFVSKNKPQSESDDNRKEVIGELLLWYILSK